jgi:hypothetical protein
MERSLVMNETTLRFPAYSMRKLENPFERHGYRNYAAIVEAADLPDLTGWRKINVRHPKLTTALPRAIAESFGSNPETFVFMNRGLVLAVDAVEFDTKTGEVTVTLSDPDRHGLLDGGHTYEIVLAERDRLAALGQKQYVKVELVEGFRSDELVDLVDARNSSNQVKDESLMELAGQFEGIKKALRDEPYGKLIAYKEYEKDSDGDALPIDIREIVSYLVAFDKTNYNGFDHPINAYRSKAACLKHYKAKPDDIAKILPIATDILKLWDTIHKHLPDFYNEARGEGGEVSGGRFGRLTGVTHLGNDQRRKGYPLFFLGEMSRYNIPAGFKYPMLGAFRALVEERDGVFGWGQGIDPVDFFVNVVGKRLAATIGEFARQEQNPSKTGKSQLVWQACYQAAEIEYLRLGQNAR